jgi:hypothetical protein
MHELNINNILGTLTSIITIFYTHAISVTTLRDKCVHYGHSGI